MVLQFLPCEWSLLFVYFQGLYCCQWHGGVCSTLEDTDLLPTERRVALGCTELHRQFRELDLWLHRPRSLSKGNFGPYWDGQHEIDDGQKGERRILDTIYFLQFDRNRWCRSPISRVNVLHNMRVFLTTFFPTFVVSRLMLWANLLPAFRPSMTVVPTPSTPGWTWTSSSGTSRGWKAWKLSQARTQNFNNKNKMELDKKTIGKEMSKTKYITIMQSTA